MRRVVVVTVVLVVSTGDTGLKVNSFNTSIVQATKSAASYLSSNIVSE